FFHPHGSPQLWKTGACEASRRARLYWRLTPSGALSLPRFSREADLPAQRTQAEAQARLSRADGYTRGENDPQAPPRQGPQAALGLTDGAPPVERRHRLSRSRDF